MNRLDHTFSDHWHRALNNFNPGSFNPHHWMYEAKAAADEVPRMAMLFAMERQGQLAKTHHQCSHDIEGTPVTDNHLICCLGTACRECPFLLSLDKMDTTPENIDVAKAWTCAAHILSEKAKPDSNFDTSEGYLLTVDDKMYWSNLYSSLAGMVDSDDEDENADPNEP